MALYGGIEAGGTKFVCAVGDELGNIQDECVVKTTTPDETLPQVIDFFKQFSHLDAVGIASFGPIETHRNAAKYGHILHTPKTAWIDCDFLGTVQQALDVPTGFDTDVNGAALGEYQYGAGKDKYNFIYMTVGTGIGAAAMVDGIILRGFDHAEMGHMCIPHDKEKDPYAGCCPYHKDCLEGLASGPSIKDRWKVKSALELPAGHEAWELEADYLAAGLLNIMMVLSPQRMIVGGGVMQHHQLFPMVRDNFKAKNNDYLHLPDNLDEFIVPPGLGNSSGVVGAFVIAQRAEKEECEHV